MFGFAMHEKRAPRWLCAGVLLLAMGWLPGGAAHAQDFEAVERRLGDAVADGEITLEQAVVMLNALRRSVGREPAPRLRGRRGELGRAAEELRQRVQAGEIPEELARRRLEEMRRETVRGQQQGEEMKRNFARVLGEAGVPREKVPDVLRAIERLAGAMKAEGEEFELHAPTRTHLEEGLGLTPRQVRMVLGMSRRLAFREDVGRMGLSPEDVARAEAELDAAVEAGRISPEDAEIRLREMREALERGEFQRRERRERRERGMQRERQERRERAERGDRAAEDRPDPQQARRRRVAAALREAGVPQERIRAVMLSVRRIAEEARAEGDGFELNPEMRLHLQELELTPEQIERVVGLARRLAAARPEAVRF